MRYKGSDILAILVLGVVIVLLGYIYLLHNLKVKITSIEPGAIGLHNSITYIKIRIENPNPLDVSIQRLEFDLYYDNNGKLVYVGHGEKENIILPAETNTTMNIPVTLSNKGLVSTIGNLILRKKTNFIVRGRLYIGVGSLSIGIPFEETIKYKQ